MELIVIHVEYDKVTFDNDIALLKLKCGVRYKSQVRKACLPRSGDEQYYTPHTRCIVAGWGHKKVAGVDELDRKMSTTLRHVTLPLQDFGECRKSTSFAVTDNMICAGSGNGNVAEDACDGDSGGPLFCRRTSYGTTTYVVIGIVSWGYGCGLKGQYGFFTNVMLLMEWIDAQMDSYSGLPYSFETCPPPKVKIY